MADVVGQIALELGVDSKSFKSQLQNLGKTAKKESKTITNSFGAIAKAATAAFSIGAITKFAKSCLDLGSDLAEVQNVVDVTFGSMSSKVNEFARDAMTSYGMSEKVAKEYMGQLGSMSKAFGNTEQAAYDQAAALTGLTGDVASFYNLSTDEAFSKLKGVFTGETEGLKALGVVMTQTALDEYALAQGFGKTTKEMSEQEKVALRLQFVTDRLSGASGDFARTADGWANQTRVLSLRFDALKASIGQGLISALTPVITMLNTLMAYLQKAADMFSNFMQSLFGKQADSPVSTLGSDLSEGSGDLAANSADAAKSAKAIKKSLAGFDNLNILGSPDSSDGGASSSGGGVNTIAGTSITPTVDDINIGSGAANALKTWLESLPKLEFSVDWATVGANVMAGLQNLWSSLVQWTTCILTISINIINDLGIDNLIVKLSELWVSFTMLIDNITAVLTPALTAFYETAISPIVQWLGEKLADAVQLVIDLFNDWGQWFEDNSESIQSVIDMLADFVKGLWDILEPIGDVAWETFKGLIKKISDFFQDFFKWVIDNKELVVGALVAITTALVAYKTAVGISALIELFKNGVIGLTIAQKAAEVAQWALNAAMSANPIGLIIAAVAGLVAGFVVLWNNCEGFRNFFIDMWDKIKKSVTGVINGLLGGYEAYINAIIKGVNFLIKAINKISFTIPDWVPEIGGKTIGFDLKTIKEVSLPRLATGGYVEANSPQLAIIGDNKREGEIVAPESKIEEAVARGFAMVMARMQQTQSSQRGSATPVVIKIGESDFWEGFIDFHNSVVRRTGESPLYI